MRPSLGYSAPPHKDIASGATLPDPGGRGALVWSTLEHALLVWNGAQWIKLVDQVDVQALQQGELGYTELVRVGDRVSSVVRYANATKALKLSETQVTRDLQGRVVATVEKSYAAGVLVQTLTTTFARGLDGRVSSSSAVQT